MRHPDSATVIRRVDTAGVPRRSRFVRAGEKDVYDPANAADLVEYHVVVNYRRS